MEVILHGLRTDRKKKMTCKQVQKKIIDFINDDMDVKELGTFIEHLESCDECKEEYDVYYTLIILRERQRFIRRKKLIVLNLICLNGALFYWKKFFFLYLSVLALFLYIEILGSKGILPSIDA